MSTAGLSSGVAAVFLSNQVLQTAIVSRASTSSSAASSGTSSSSATSSGTSSSSAAGTGASSTQAAFYASPILTFDAETGAIVWEYRDTSTGAFEYQSPSRAALLYGQSQQLTGGGQAGFGGSQVGGIGRTVSLYG